MKFSILINCHNQSKYINDCIISCLNQRYPNFEVIVTDSSFQKLNLKKFVGKKKFEYIYVGEKYKYPEMNQMFKIMTGLKKTSGDYICLLDGDDKFSDQKLRKIFRILKNNKVDLYQDIPVINNKKQKISIFSNNLRNNYFFKNFLISWPQVFGTSSITVKRNILMKFFSEAHPFNWKLLAIDIQLLIYCFTSFKISEGFNKTTYKRIHNNNLGSKYLNYFSKIFWLRRICQHKYNSFVNKKKIYNLDYFVTVIINKFF
tara:strand:+ start:2573 stop:3349 length:777 start_codon:yes stop_codon:yes gene_type:complete